MVILRSFLIKSYVAPKRVVIFSLPYTGLHSIQIRKQIIKLFPSAYPRISTTMYFSTGTKIVISFFFFQFKYRIPLGLRLRIVYKFKCQCCDALYFGETIRHLHTCISEHMGISACTGKPLSKSSFSDILSHHQSSGHPIEL